MSRRFVTQLADQETVDEVFIASEKQLRTNRNGNLYLQVRLGDRSGTITGMLWNANDRIYDSFENGDYVRVQGTAQFYNGAMQMIVNRVDKTVVEKVIESDFVTLTSEQVDKLLERVAELLRGMRNVHLRTLADCFLANEDFMSGFRSAPAGIKNHHAYRGGLLEHVLSLMELAILVSPRYSHVDDDLLLMGAFLHDIGKIEELSYERDLGYTDVGQMIGHLVIGVSMLQEQVKAAEASSGESFPDELALRLEHMIVSHHGQLEYGSPKLPMTPEAVALHFLDNLDSKLHTVGQLIREDPNAGSRWTPYQPSLSRKIYKGNGS